MIGFPKPEPRTRTKGRADRHAATVVKSVRAICVDRDGDCRFGNWQANPNDWHSDALECDVCDGPSQWAHLGEQKRFKTRGQPPEVRHTTAGSLMLCERHHWNYDHGTLDIVGDDANARLKFIGQSQPAPVEVA